MLRAIIVAGLVSLAMLGGASTAKAKSPRSAPECTKANSEILSVRDIMAASDRDLGECVGVQGLRVGDAIFSDREAVYRFFTSKDVRKHSAIGIHYNPFLEHQYEMDRGTYFGRVVSCAEDRRAFSRTSKALNKQNLKADGEDDAIIMIHHRGWCSWAKGFAISMGDKSDVLEATEMRLSGEANRLALGDLEWVKSNDPEISTIRWLADIALRVPCEPDFKISGPPVSYPSTSPEVHAPYRNLAWAKEAAKVCPRRLDDLAMFRVRDSSSSYEKGAKLDLVFCLCRTPDCKEKWPIAVIDIGWLDKYPYICERASISPTSYETLEDGTDKILKWGYTFQQGYGAPGGFWESIGFAEPSESN